MHTDISRTAMSFKTETSLHELTKSMHSQTNKKILNGLTAKL